MGNSLGEVLTSLGGKSMVENTHPMHLDCKGFDGVDLVEQNVCPECRFTVLHRLLP